MRRIAKLVDMNSKRTYNLTNLVMAGVKEITIGRAETDSNQLIPLGAKEDGTRYEHPRIPCISRYHALIRYDESSGHYLLLDRCSTHGTTVDDKTLEAMVPHILENGDSIKFADYGPILFIIEEVPERAERRDTAYFPRS